MEEYVITDKKRQNWLIAIVSSAIFMFSVDYSMVNISLPVIAKYFGVTLNHVSRVPLAYLLVVTSTVLLFGKLGDIKGFKKIFIIGLGIFITGTFLCGIAPTFNALLGLRIYQCIGEAMFSPMAIAIATVFLPPQVRGKALGFMATAQGLGFCMGPVLGGYIAGHLGWHGIFFVNIPIGVLIAVAAARLIPSRQQIPEDKSVDSSGAVLIFASLATLVFALNSISSMGLRSPILWVFFAISAIAFTLFILREHKARNPILQITLFANRDFTFATLSAFCVIFVYIGLIFLFPFYFSMVHNVDIMNSGFLLMTPALMVIIFAPIAGVLSDRFGSRFICAFGIAMTTLAFFMFSLLKPGTPVSHILPSLMVAGMAIGFFLPANNKLIMILAPSDKQGMASAVYKIINSTGGVFGIAILPLIIMKKIDLQAALAHVGMSTIRHDPKILVAGFNAAFNVCIFVCLAGLIFTLLARDRKA